jgi:UDP-N-acetylmuramate dehydrogenase
MILPLCLQEKISLKTLNWWKVGGEAEYFAAPKTKNEVIEVLKWWSTQKTAEKSSPNLLAKMPLWIISGGSNVLIQDGLIRGLVLSTHELRGIEVKESSDELYLTCSAGTPKSDVARHFIKNKLSPSAFLTGIPGDMAGGVVMNAGIAEARVPREFCEFVREIEVVRVNEKTNEIETHVFKNKDISWAYRHSSGWQPGIIVRVDVAWKNNPDPQVLVEMKEQTKKRVSTQPLDLPSCGSTFRNPEGKKAAQLIDQCGLKGFRVGGAQVSPKHANFIVNDQGASAQDIYAIIQHVKKTVFEKTSVPLQTEVVLIGQW